jgi:hypothetical protein
MTDQTATKNETDLSLDEALAAEVAGATASPSTAGHDEDLVFEVFASRCPTSE